uniref:Uncharacterized protein n=1 Tax=Branchiostoma floridae TaxID=7739 RepID=C3YEE5_BRAFL|eukprot:XP_002605443.1 hypothetical protein BRAFLDRAFT_74257 [Branchiostoma floridae]
MFGAGRRKIRPPARFVSSPAEDNELEWHSTPAELSKRLEKELLDVTRQLEKMKADIGADLERAGRVCTPLPTNAFEDDGGGQRSPIPEIPARIQDGTRAPRAEVRATDPPARHSFPTLREVRAFHQLQSDPAEFLRHVPRHTKGEQRGAAGTEGHPPPPKYNTQHAEVQKLKEDHLRRPSLEMEHSHAHGGPQQAAPTERAGGPRSTYCYRYQANTCTFVTDHISASVAPITNTYPMHVVTEHMVKSNGRDVIMVHVLVPSVYR